ncbi:MAG: hypothetical protein K1565_05540 [Candidatus Thiodiazotropha sp. (ex. Lucinisca nassula)]|nr:hypothetical protein [Candidatus Thiodiazotropha sp. (ex. Lucinisca nassula)]
MKSVACLLGILGMLALPARAEESVHDGPYSDKECVGCHTERDPELIWQWQTSRHGPGSGLGCISCHGNLHSISAINARHDSACTGCHAGPASHSYATSKHGVISALDAVRQDWGKPLKRGNYRTPGCSYCHLHDGDHGDTMTPARGPEVRQWICAGCHSPRYVREQFSNAQRQLEIADLKLEEGNALIAAISDPKTDALSELGQSLNHHRKNVLYGVGHQSPDYQWWHGQPALDGDLIRIRDAISEYLYQRVSGDKQ